MLGGEAVSRGLLLMPHRPSNSPCLVSFEWLASGVGVLGGWGGWVWVGVGPTHKHCLGRHARRPRRRVALPLLAGPLHLDLWHDLRLHAPHV